MSLVSPRGQALAIWLSVFTLVVFVVTGLRFYMITKIRPRPFRTEDALIILSVIAMLALEGPTFWAIHNGLGAHTATLAWDHIAVQIKLIVSAAWTWTISTCSCKISLLLLYLRLFRPVPMFRRLVWVLIALNIVYVVVFITFFMTQCSPIWAAWDEVLSQTNCRPITIQQISSVAANLFLDLSVVLVPIPFVIQLHMPLNKKIGVCVIFSLGFGVIGILSWRLYTTLVPEVPPDTVYDIYILALQSHLELYLGIIAANLPTLGPLLTRMPKLKIFSFNRSSPSSGASGSGRKPFPPVTFGSWGQAPQKPNGDELYLLSRNDGGTNNNKTQILQRHEFGVSIELSDNVKGTLPAHSSEITHPQNNQAQL